MQSASWTVAAGVCGALAIVSSLVDVSSVLRMFLPRPVVAPKGDTVPTVRWEVFRLLNWVVSATFLLCVVHLTSLQHRGVSALSHSKFVAFLCCLCLVRQRRHGVTFKRVLLRNTCAAVVLQCFCRRALAR